MNPGSVETCTVFSTKTVVNRAAYCMVGLSTSLSHRVSLFATIRNNRGSPAAGGHLPEERPGPEEQDVVEGHAGTFLLAAVYHVVMYLWSAVQCAEAECVCCIVNVVGCWTRLFTVVCLDASTALAGVYTVLCVAACAASVLAGVRYLCSKLFARALTRDMHLLQRINRLRNLCPLC
jgi:hypothetical protein